MNSHETSGSLFPENGECLEVEFGLLDLEIHINTLLVQQRYPSLFSNSGFRLKQQLYICVNSC